MAHLTRRLLLSLGALALLEGCTHASPQAVQPLTGDIPGDSHDIAPHLVRVSSGQSADCSHRAEARDKAGGPRHYINCHRAHEIALTLDDGPHPEWTPKVLKLLAQHNIQATFFLIGRQAAVYPKLVKAMSGAGHQVANHTWNHPMPFGQLTAGRIRDEIHRTSDSVHAITGQPPTWFRAPGGAWSPTVLAEVAAAGLSPMDWSVDPWDWSRPGVPHIVDKIMANTRPGSIILEHDGGGDRSQTLEALTIVLPRLLDAGYVFTKPGHSTLHL